MAARKGYSIETADSRPMLFRLKNGAYLSVTREVEYKQHVSCIVYNEQGEEEEIYEDLSPSGSNKHDIRTAERLLSVIREEEALCDEEMGEEPDPRYADTEIDAYLGQHDESDIPVVMQKDIVRHLPSAPSLPKMSEEEWKAYKQFLCDRTDLVLGQEDEATDDDLEEPIYEDDSYVEEIKKQESDPKKRSALQDIYIALITRTYLEGNDSPEAGFMRDRVQRILDAYGFDEYWKQTLDENGWNGKSTNEILKDWNKKVRNGKQAPDVILVRPEKNSRRNK